MTGMVRVACCMASMAELPLAKIRSVESATSSAAELRMRFGVAGGPTYFKSECHGPPPNQACPVRLAARPDAASLLHHRRRRP